MFLIFHAFSFKNKFCFHIVFSSYSSKLTAFVSWSISLLLDLLSSGPVSASYVLNYLDWTNLNCLVSVRSGIDEITCTQFQDGYFPIQLHSYNLRFTVGLVTDVTLSPLALYLFYSRNASATVAVVVVVVIVIVLVVGQVTIAFLKEHFFHHDQNTWEEHSSKHSKNLCHQPQ